MEVNIEKIRPLIKWTGGKYDEYKLFQHFIPRFKRYYEPFFGGGGVFFALQPQGDSYVNDVSKDLVQFYRNVSNHKLQRELWKYVKAWEQTAVLAFDIAQKLLPNVSLYLEGRTNEDILLTAIQHTIATIKRRHYKPLFQPSFICYQHIFSNYLLTSLVDKCKKLKTLQTKSTIVSDEVVRKQLETAIHAAFYMHIRWLYNNYAKKQKQSE